MTSRRTWLGNAGAAAIYTLAPRIRPLSAAAVPASDQVAVGFIGSGIRGTQLLGEFLSVPGMRPVTVCDLYDGCLQRAKEQTEGKADVTKDYRAVLDRKDVEAVVIATPDHLHKRMLLDALSAGKHVYIEKPMSWNIAEGREMTAVAEKSKCLVQVGSQGKTSPLTAKAREIVKSGVLGKVNMVRMLNHRNDAQGAWRYPVPPDASTRTIEWDKFLGDRPKRPFDANVFFRWRCWWEFSGGVATDLFVHLLTWLHEVMDVRGPQSVVSQGGIYRWNDGRNVPDVMNSVFHYDGFIADMYVNLGCAYPMRGITIMGSQGTMVEEGGKLIVYPERAPRDVQTYGTLSWPKAMRASYFESHGYTAEGRPRSPLPEPKKPEEFTIPEGPSHYELFVTSVREGKPSRETALEGHMAAGAAHLANIAYRESRLAKWDLNSGTVS